jgi:hypothetical protein
MASGGYTDSGGSNIFWHFLSEGHDRFAYPGMLENSYK